MEAEPCTAQDAVGSSRTKDDAPTLRKYCKKQKLSNGRTRDMPSFVFGYECAFCNSVGVTEATGPMCCYRDGKLIAVEEANRSCDVKYVHQKCVEWAPLVSFSGETVKNFEVEVQRASKIICSKCGMTGAALGCYFASCHESFHVPCALQIPDCRWDCVNFHVLCPSHCSEIMPCDEDSDTNAQKTHLPSVQIDSTKSSEKLTEHQWNKDCVAPNGVEKGRIFIGSGLTDPEMSLLDKAARFIGGTVTKTWRQNVTHVIASTKESGACKRTHNLLLAILNGKSILTTKWIKACMEVGHLVLEEPFEVKFAVHGSVDRAKDKAQKLFTGLYFYLSVHFTLSSKESLEDLIVAAGGRVLAEDRLIMQNPFAGGSPFLYFIYNEDPPPEYNPRDLMKIVNERCKEAVGMFKKTGALVTSNTRLLDAIAAFGVQPLKEGNTFNETSDKI